MTKYDHHANPIDDRPSIPYEFVLLITVSFLVINVQLTQLPSVSQLRLVIRFARFPVIPIDCSLSLSVNSECKIQPELSIHSTFGNLMFPALETDSSDTPFVRILKLGFQWLGKQIARRPWIWFGISTLLTILFSSKIPFTPLSNDVSDFTPSAARARIELQRYKEFFANSGDPVNVYVFVTAKRDGNMLGIRELEEAVRLLNIVSDQVTLYDSIGNQNLTFSQFCKHFCTINEPIRHFYNGLLVNSNFGNATEHIDLGYPITTVLGRQLHMDPNFFGVKIEVKVGNDSRVVAVNSLRTASGKSFLSLDNPQVRNNIREIKLIGLQFRAELPVNWPKTSIQKWELDVVNYVRNEFKSKYVDALVVSETFLTGEVVRAGLTLIPFLVIGFVIMCLFSIVTMSLSAFYMFQLGPEKIILAIMAPICPFMACGTALGLMFWMGFRFGSILCVTGFLVLAIGVDDAYLMVSAWQLLRKRQKKEGALCAKETRSQRLESLLVGVMMETGPSITVTTLTNALAFAIGISSSTPEIQLFSIGNALAITLDYVYQWTIYGAVMVIAGHWELKNEETTVDDVEKKQVVKPKTNIIGGLLRQVHVLIKTFFERCLSIYCKLLTNGFVASMVMALLAGYMYFSIYGILEMRAELRPEQLFLRNSDVSKVLDLRNKYIIPFYAVCIVFVNKPGNFSDPNNLQRLSNMVADFERLPSSLGKFSTKFFLRDYMEFVKNADETAKVAFDELLELEGSELELTKPRSFNSNELEVFLNWPEFSFWNGFVNLEENSENGDSWKLKKFFFTTASYGVDLTDWSRRAELLQQWRSVADSYPEYDISVFEDDAKFLDLIPTMIPQTAQSAICTLICMFLVCLLFIRQPTAVIVANFSIFSTCIGVFGILSLMGVELDPITYSASIMSIGFSVDIPAHLVFHFYKTGGDGKTPMTTEHRLKHCLGSIGFPIFEAGISTIICVSSLNFVDLHMASVFARTMVLVVSIGLIHGILVIPVFFYLISLIPVWPRPSATIPPDPSPPKQPSAQPILLEVNASTMFENPIYEQKPSTKQLVVNCYELNIEKSKKIYRYRVEFKGHDGQNIVEDLLDRVSKCTAQQMLQRFFDVVVDLDSIGSRAFHENPDEKDLYVFDHQNFFAYSTSAFETVETDQIFPVMILDQDLWKIIAKDNEWISIKLTQDVDLNSHALYDEYRQFLEVLTWQSTLKDIRNQYYVLDDGAYKRADAVKIPNQGRIGRTGFKKRIIMTKTHYYLQLFPHNEVFFPVQTIYSYLIRELNTTDEELAKCLAIPQCSEAMLLHLDGVIVYDRQLKTTFRIKEFSDRPVRKTRVEYNGKKIRLNEWYKNVYGHTAYEDIPCVVNYGEGTSYSLLENLDIVDGQYGQGQFEVNETSESMERFQTLSQNEVIRRLNELTIAEKSRPYLNEFGIKIATLPTMVRYTEFLAPEVVYADEFDNVVVDNRSARAWELSGSYRFHQHSELAAGKSWALLKLVDSTFTNKKENIFVGHLNRFGKALQLGNIQTENASLPKVDVNIYTWCEQLIKKISTGRAVIIIVASDTWKAKIYKPMKFFEAQMNVVTVFVSEADASQNNWKPVIARVAHKVNARLGGVNFVLNTSKATKLNGLEQVHQSLNNMQFFGVFCQKVDHDFSAIGVAYTKNSALQIGGSCWMDKTDIDGNDRLPNEIYSAIVAWSMVNKGRMPTDILIYTHAFQETTFLKDILEKVEEKLKMPSIKLPRFFIVSIDTQCTECFLPTSWLQQTTGKLWTNFPAGTCVDSKILNSNNFLLITSWPLHAVAFIRPFKFTVKSLSTYRTEISIIEHMSYYLCAVHPVERRLIGLPLPLRAATDFVASTSANLSTLKFMSEDLQDDPFADGLSIDVRCDKINQLIGRKQVPYFCA